MKNRYLKLLITISVLSLFWSCEPDKYPTEMQDRRETIRLKVLPSQQYSETKSSYGSDIDQMFTSAELLVYNSTTGALEIHRHLESEDLNTTILISLLQGYKYDFYLFGNMFKVRKSDGGIEVLDIPLSNQDLENWSYRLDGSDIDDKYRYQTMEEISNWGIPLSWMQLDVDPFTESAIEVRMSRMFSKLRLVIDHTGISGSALSDFVDGKVFIKQVNTLLTPFSSSGSKALSASDILAQGDYEFSMDGDNGKEFIFYVPENMQGELLPSNVDPRQKNLDNITSTYSADKAAVLTYLEFQGKLNGDAGYTGDATYRFLLGSNTTRNFDVKGNVDRLVELSFNPNSIYEASWKVKYEGLEDNRTFYLSGDLAGRLPEGKEIVVRPSRPGCFNLNIEMPDGSNAISQAKLVDAGYSPSSLTDYAWTSNVYSMTHNSLNEPMRSTLEACGITASYSDGKMVFSVSNPALFVPGKSVEIGITFYPGGETVTALIVTKEDIQVEERSGKNLSEDFFVGQKRILDFAGFVGDTLYYAASQAMTGPKGQTGAYNRHWKTTPEQSASFPACIRDAEGSIVLPYQSKSGYESQYILAGESLPVYAHYPNNNVYGIEFQKADAIIYICTNDIHNDGIVQLPVKISLPYYAGTSLNASGDNYILAVDGSPREIRHQFYTSYGGDKLYESDFDPYLYDALIKPSRSYSDGCNEWIKQCVETDDNSIFLSKTILNNTKIENVKFDSEKRDTIYFNSNPATGLFPSKRNTIACNIQQPSFPEKIGDEYSSYFNDKITDKSFGFGINHGFTEGDLSRVSLTMEGPSNYYKCSDGTIVKPTIDLYATMQTVFWSYNEDDQVTQAASGEKVPGCLIVPYGLQTVTMNVTNIHDNRKIAYECSFNMCYEIVLTQLPVYPSYGDASVYMMGIKNARYLINNAADMSKEGRLWVMKTLDTLAWQEEIASVGDFKCMIDGTTTYPAGNQNVVNRSGIPRTGYKAKYVDPDASSWSVSLAEKVLNDDNYSMICDPYFYNASGLDQNVNSNPSITGNSYLRLIVGNTDKQGYIFMNDFL